MTGATTQADEIAAAIVAVAREVEHLPALSRTRPHAFCEDKDAAARRLDAIAAQVRNTFGGAPARVVPGTIEIPGRPLGPARPRRVRVEVRRRAG